MQLQQLRCRIVSYDKVSLEKSLNFLKIRGA